MARRPGAAGSEPTSRWVLTCPASQWPPSAELRSKPGAARLRARRGGSASLQDAERGARAPGTSAGPRRRPRLRWRSRPLACLRGPGCARLLPPHPRTGLPHGRGGSRFFLPPNPCITVSRAEPGRGDRGARKDILEGYRAEWLVTKDEAAPGHAPQPSVCSVQRLPTAPALPPGGGELRSVKKTASGRVKGTCDRREEPSCGGSGPGPAGHKEQH